MASFLPPSLLPRPESCRPWFLRLLMRGLGHAWERQLLEPPHLRPERLRQMAQEATGLEAERDDAFFQQELPHFLAALEETAALGDFGRLLAHGSLLKTMKERLRVAAIFARHPEIAAIPLAPPIIIAGPMRSGTTRLQRLLAADPGLEALRLYESLAPVPGRGRRLRVAAALRLVHAINPATAAIHPTAATRVDEEVGLLAHSLFGPLLEVPFFVPAFARHQEKIDPTPAYRRLRELLQLRCWSTQRDPARPLVLKAPQYLADVGVLAALFPGARFLFLQRALPTVVASSASLAYHHLLLSTDRIKASAIGQQWLWKTVWRNARAQQARKTLPAARQLDVSYEAMSADPLAGLRRIYAFLGRPLPIEVRRGARRLAPQSRALQKQHRHRYRLQDFGLESREVERFAARFVLGDLPPHP